MVPSCWCLRLCWWLSCWPCRGAGVCAGSPLCRTLWGYVRSSHFRKVRGSWTKVKRDCVRNFDSTSKDGLRRRLINRSDNSMVDLSGQQSFCQYRIFKVSMFNKKTLKRSMSFPKSLQIAIALWPAVAQPTTSVKDSQPTALSSSQPNSDPKCVPSRRR